MNVRITSTGKVHSVDDRTGAVLIEALPSVFELAQRPAAAPTPKIPEKRWGLFHKDSGGVAIELIQGVTKSWFDGFPHRAWQAFPDVPDHVLREYVRLWRYPYEVTLPQDEKEFEKLQEFRSKLLGQEGK